MNLPTIHATRTFPFTEYLSMNGFAIEELENNVYRVVRDSELPVFVSVTEESVYFEVDAGSLADIGSEELYRELLQTNTEILPVSFGINQTENDARLVLVESRLYGDLNSNELLGVFDALELAADRAETLLNKFLKL